MADVGLQAYPDNKQVMGAGEPPRKKILVDRRISKVKSQIQIIPTAQYRFYSLSMVRMKLITGVISQVRSTKQQTNESVYRVYTTWILYNAPCTLSDNIFYVEFLHMLISDCSYP